MSLTKVTYSMIAGAPANVSDYGAVGDGVADDTAAIQSALSSGSKSIVFPAGTYLVNGALTCSTASVTITATEATIKLKNSATNKYILNVTGANSTVIGGTWDGNQSNGNTGPDVFSNYSVRIGGNGSTIRNAKSINQYGTGFKGIGNYLTFDGCSVSGVQGYGIFVDQSAGVSYTGNRAVNNFINLTGGDPTFTQGILFTAGSGQAQTAWELSGNNVIGVNDAGCTDQPICLGVRGNSGVVSNNQTRYGSMGFSEGGDKTVVIGNRFLDLRGTSRIGIEPSGKQVISGNYVTNSLRGVAITASVNYDGSSITNNYIQNDAAAGQGIYIQIAATFTGKNIIVANNYVSGKVAFYAVGNVDNLLINGNVLVGPGSGVAGSRGLYLDTISTAGYVTVSGNVFTGFERSMSIYSAGATTFTDLYALGNISANDSNTSSLSWTAEGSAVVGDRCCNAYGISAFGGARVSLLDQDSSTRTVFGTGSPEGAVTAGVGSTYMRQDGGAGTSFYIKETGTGNTGWVGK